MITVFGATGNIGRHVVTQLGELGVPARAVTRRPGAVRHPAPPGIRYAGADLTDPASLPPVLEGADRIFLVTGGDTTLHEGNLLDAAIDAGVSHVVRASGSFLVGPDASVLFDQWHYEAEQALERSGLAWTHLRPSYFMQNLLVQGASGRLALPLGDARVNLVDTRDIAAVAVAALTNDGHDGQTYAVTGPQALTFAEVAATLSVATGRPFTYEAVTPAAFADQVRGWGVPDEFAEALSEEYDIIGQHQPAFETIADTVPRVTGRAGITLAQFAHDYAAAFAAPEKEQP